MKYVYFFAALFFLLAWLLPNHYLPWLSVYQESSMAIAGFILSVILIKKYKIEIPRFIFFLLLISLVPLIQYSLGVIYFFGEAFVISLYLLGLTTACILGFNISKLQPQEKNKIIIGFFIVLLIASIISVWIQMRQWLLFEGNIWTVDLAPNGRPFANVAQPNLLSTLLTIGCISTLYLFENKKINVSVASLAALFLIFGIVLAQSRTAWVFSAIFIVWWLFKSKKIIPRLTPKYLFFWISLYISFLFFVPYLSQFLGITDVRGIGDRATTGLQRIEMWKQILIAIREAPLLGYGWGQVNIAQMSITSSISSTPVFGYSHNIILDLFIWNGFVLGSLIIIVITSFFLKLLLQARTTNSVLMLTCVGAILVHSLFEYPFAYTYFLLPFGFLIGFVYAEIKNKYVSFYLSSKIYTAYLLFLFCLISYVLIEYVRSSQEYQLMRYENVQLRETDIQKNEFDFMLLGQINEYIWFARETELYTLNNQQLERMRKVVYRYPEQPLLYKYIKVLVMNNKKLEAKKMIDFYNTFFDQSLTLEKIIHITHLELHDK